jgi:hypothetical protein
MLVAVSRRSKSVIEGPTSSCTYATYRTRTPKQSLDVEQVLRQLGIARRRRAVGQVWNKIDRLDCDANIRLRIVPNGSRSSDVRCWPALSGEGSTWRRR